MKHNKKEERKKGQSCYRMSEKEALKKIKEIKKSGKTDVIDLSGCKVWHSSWRVLDNRGAAYHPERL